MQEFTRKIKSTRMALGMSQEALAEISGLSLRSIQRIEGGETTPRGDSLHRIAQALQLDVQELTRTFIAPATAQSVLEGMTSALSDSSSGDHAVRELSTVQSKPENGVAILMLLSAYLFMLHPLIGLGVPLLLFLLYKNTNPQVKKFGRKLIWLESIYCGLVLFGYAYIFLVRAFHFRVPDWLSFEYSVIFMLSMYVLHIVAISIFIVQFVKSSRKLETDNLQIVQPN